MRTAKTRISLCISPLIRFVIVRWKKHLLPGYPQRAQRRLISACADLSLCWDHMSGVTLSHMETSVQLMYVFAVVRFPSNTIQF